MQQSLRQKTIRVCKTLGLPGARIKYQNEMYQHSRNLESITERAASGMAHMHENQ